MDNVKHIKTRLGIVAVAALVIATGAIATQIALAQQPGFLVGVTNNTTTPAQGADHPEGQIETECGLDAWRKIAKSWHTQFIDCYPSTATDSFDLTYKSRLADDDAGGNAVYHSATVTISCTRVPTIRRSQTQPPPNSS